MSPHHQNHAMGKACLYRREHLNITVKRVETVNRSISWIINWIFLVFCDITANKVFIAHNDFQYTRIWVLLDIGGLHYYVKLRKNEMNSWMKQYCWVNSSKTGNVNNNYFYLRLSQAYRSMSRCVCVCVSISSPEAFAGQLMGSWCSCNTCRYHIVPTVKDVKF